MATLLVGAAELNFFKPKLRGKTKERKLDIGQWSDSWTCHTLSFFFFFTTLTYPIHWEFTNCILLTKKRIEEPKCSLIIWEKFRLPNLEELGQMDGVIIPWRPYVWDALIKQLELLILALPIYYQPTCITVITICRFSIQIRSIEKIVKHGIWTKKRNASTRRLLSWKYGISYPSKPGFLG